MSYIDDVSVQVSKASCRTLTMFLFRYPRLHVVHRRCVCPGIQGFMSYIDNVFVQVSKASCCTLTMCLSRYPRLHVVHRQCVCPGIQGFMSYIDENGDAEGNYTLLARMPYESQYGNYSMLPVGHFEVCRDHSGLPVGVCLYGFCVCISV